MVITLVRVANVDFLPINRGCNVNETKCPACARVSPDLPDRRRNLNHAAARASWNCSSSVEPFSATVEDCPPWMVWVTASK